jgi:hypothetical protein
LIPSKVAPATADKVASKYFITRVSRRLGIGTDSSYLNLTIVWRGVAKW